MNFAFSRKDFWNLTDWIVLGIIVAWAIAKSFGWINTPDFIEMVPIFGAAFMGGRFVQKLSGLEKRFDKLEIDVKEFKTEVRTEFKSFGKDVDGVKTQTHEIRKELHGTNIHLENLSQKVAHL